MNRIALLACILLVGMPQVQAAQKIHRSASAVKHFRAQSPCPATHSARGRCPGWIVDHVVPLCAGGADAPSNMQWQTAKDAKLKDRDERAQCRLQKRHQ